MAFPTTGLIDDFNRANADPAGGKWSGPVFTGDFPWKVLSNQFTPQAGNSWHSSWYNAATFGPDCEIWSTAVSFPTPGAARTMNHYLRLSNASSATPTFYYLGVDPSTNGWRIRKVVGGTDTALGTGATQALTANDGIGFSAIGTTLTSWWRTGLTGAWTQLESFTDSAITGTGFIAVECNIGTPFTLDDLGGGTAMPTTVVSPQVPADNPPRHFGPF